MSSMPSLHPVSVLFLALAVLGAATVRSGEILFSVCIVVALISWRIASLRFRQLLRRSRWLLLSMLLIFSFLTPGTHVRYLPGTSSEGVVIAVEQAARLLLAISVLALLLTRLNPGQLISAMHTAFAPLRRFGIDRDRIAVRIALTLEAVEGDTAPAMGGEQKISLPRQPIGRLDWACAVLSLGLLASVYLP